MKEFESIFDVPPDFEGECCCHGGRYWFIEGGRNHRDDGPAIIYSNGTRHWYFYGAKHRLDGPASHYADGTKHYFIQDKKYSEQEYWLHPLVIQNKLEEILGG